MASLCFIIPPAHCLCSGTSQSFHEKIAKEKQRRIYEPHLSHCFYPWLASFMDLFSGSFFWWATCAMDKVKTKNNEDPATNGVGAQHLGRLDVLQ